MDTDVAFTPVDDAAVNDRVDAAYRAEYGHYTGCVEPLISTQARTTTLRLLRGPDGLAKASWRPDREDGGGGDG